MREVPPDIITPYAIQDARLTLKDYQYQQPIIMKKNLSRVAQLECDLIPVTWAMRLEGVPVDLDKAEQVNIRMKAEGDAYLSEVRQTHPYFEPTAARSLEKYVNSFGVFPPRTPTDEPSITNEWLMGSDHPEFHALAAYRVAEKIRRDFVEAVVLEMSFKGKIHPSWASTRGSDYSDDVGGTRTGRLACELPNLAQIPKRHKVLGPLMRSMFVPRPGECWHKADYASQEPRISLHYAVKYGLPGAEEIAQRYYADRKVDYHQMVTDLVNNVSSRVQIDRDQGKTINLGLIYGLGKDKLAFKLLMTRPAVEMLLRIYHRAIPFVKPLQVKTRNFAEKYGYITTELGRRRRFELWEKAGFGPRTKPLPKAEAIAEYQYIRRAMTYKALNACVQGTAAEQCKTAMVQLHREGLTPLVTLYDELDHSIPPDPKISQRICEVMEQALPLKIPHLADAKMGKDWSCKVAA
jgi:DNA polymerase-1